MGQSLTSCRVMMAQYSLTWELFSQNFKGLLQNTSFQNFDLPEPFDDQYRDVTLVSNDYVSFKANKLVLSACSPILKTLLEENQNQSGSQCLVLAGLNHQDLESILNFVYHGELLVRDTHKKDEIKGWFQTLGFGNNVDYGEQSKFDQAQKIDKNIKKEVIEKALKKHVNTNNEIIKPQIKQSISSNHTRQNKNNFVKNIPPLKHVKTEQKQAAEESTMNATFLCDKCDHISTSNSSLEQHIEDAHDGEGLQYQCTKCEFEGTSRRNLVSHTRMTHEGMTFRCARCDYTTKWRGNYMRHNKEHGN